MASEQPKLLAQVAAGMGGVVLASSLLQGLSRRREADRLEELFLRAHAKAHAEALQEAHRHAHAAEERKPIETRAAAWLVLGGVVAGSALAAFLWRRHQTTKVREEAAHHAADEVRDDWKAEHAAPEPLL